MTTLNVRRPPHIAHSATTRASPPQTPSSNRNASPLSIRIDTSDTLNPTVAQARTSATIDTTAHQAHEPTPDTTETPNPPTNPTPHTRHEVPPQALRAFLTSHNVHELRVLDLTATEHHHTLINLLDTEPHLGRIVLSGMAFNPADPLDRRLAQLVLALSAPANPDPRQPPTTHTP